MQPRCQRRSSGQGQYGEVLATVEAAHSGTVVSCLPMQFVGKGEAGGIIL